MLLNIFIVVYVLQDFPGYILLERGRKALEEPAALAALEARLKISK